MLCALSLYLWAFYDPPGEAFLFFGLVFLTITSNFGTPFSVQTDERLIEVQPGLPESGKAAKFRVPSDTSVVLGLACVLAAAALTGVESMQIVSDPWLREVHGALLATFGVGLAGFRRGAYVNLKGHRALIRWYSLFGVRLKIRRVVLSGDRLVLYRLLTRYSSRYHTGVSLTTRLCLVSAEGTWTFLHGAKASDASAVAASLGLESFLCYTDDATRGLAQLRGQLAVDLKEPSLLQVGAPAPPVPPHQIAMLVAITLFVAGVTALYWTPVGTASKDPAVLANPQGPTSAQTPQKSPLQELLHKGTELYLETVEKDLAPSQREQNLKEAVAAFEQAAELGAKDNDFHRKALFALKRYDDALALVAESDLSGRARERLAAELRADGHYEAALKYVDSALTVGAPCERSILRANLLLDLGRTQDGLNQFYSLSSCPNSPGRTELTRRVESL